MTSTTFEPPVASPDVPRAPVHPALTTLLFALRQGVVIALALLAIAWISTQILRPALASVRVDEDVTDVAARLALLLLPGFSYLGAAAYARRLRATNWPLAIGVSALAVTLLFGGLLLAQTVFNPPDASAGQQGSLQLTLAEAEGGILVEAVEPGGAGEIAGVLPGDLITALRRDPVTRDELLGIITESEADTPLRLRIMRAGEELQITVRSVRVAAEANANPLNAVLSSWAAALAVGVIGVVWPGGWVPYMLLGLTLIPLLTGYLWLIIATFSYRTEGLLPIGPDGTVGGFTLDNWQFLSGESISGITVNIWAITLNSFLIASIMTAASLVLCSMTAYALSRMEFVGRRLFLSMTLILHGFPAVTLLIPIYLVLIALGGLPLIGQFIGFNSIGGIALVMIAFELPLGVWLMKGFFDNISWDMERSALIDGASRWRTFWEIILPQIRPGLLALGVFAFIGGWNAYLIPATYSIGRGTSNLPVYIRELTGDISPVNWNLVAAVGLFQLIPILIFFVFAQEYLLNIYGGGTKGTS